MSARENIKSNELKTTVRKEIDSLRSRLVNLSLKIHNNPELKFEEYKASKWLISILKEYDFQVEEGIANLKTAFRATYHGLPGGPTIAFTAEYDALPKLGHACGHNLIATASLGATLGIRSILKKVPGNIKLIGTPAEESGGGKVIMVKEGIFDNVDAAMMFHPSNKTIALRNSIARKAIKIEFFGKSAHAAAKPEEGINALDATIQTFNSINALREHIKDRARIHGIITNGGEAPNIVPDYSSSYLYVRAPKDDYCEEIFQKVKNCAKGASIATGATVKFNEEEATYKSSKFNPKLAEIFKSNLESLGEVFDKVDPHEGTGSTDMGDVSRRIPAIHPYIAIGPKNLVPHSPEFAKASISDRAHKAMIKAAKALAMTAVDIFTKPELLKEIKDDFTR